MSLINAAQALTSTLDLDEVLQQLINETLNVIDGADAILLFVYDKRSGKKRGWCRAFLFAGN